MSKKNSNILAIAVMFFLFMMISFVTGLQNPFGVIVKNQFNASDFMSQLGNAANFVAYAFMGLPAGMILARRGYKFTALLAVVVGFVGVAITFFSGTDFLSGLWKEGRFIVYLLGAFVSGFSMCMLNTVVNPLLNNLGGGGNRGNQLIQFGGSLNSLSATICPVFLGYLIGSNIEQASISKANPALYCAMAVFAFAFVVIFFTNIPESDSDAENTNLVTSVTGALSYKHFVFGIIAIFLYVGVEVGIPNFANLYMTGELKISAAVAGSFVGMYWFMMLIGRLIGGVIGGKISSRVMIASVSSLAIVFLMAGILLKGTANVMFPAITKDLNFSLENLPIEVMFFLLCGLCTSVMWGAIFNLSVQNLGKYTAVASGIFMVMVCGGGLLPLIQGAVSDSFGYVTSYYVIVAAVAYILWFAISGSKVKTNV